LGGAVNCLYRATFGPVAIRYGNAIVAVYLAIAGILAVVAMMGSAQRAEALPSFARQTGQPCGKCHTDFPALTPFGRRFKLLGYTIGGGEYRTTLFPSTDDARGAVDKARSYAKAMDSGSGASAQQEYVPPISFMVMTGFTHTQADQQGLDPFKPNDNFTLVQASAFWGGAITDNIGAFAQVTYSPDGWSWDNADVRYAKATKLGNMDVVYGITANNNPTVQDAWNTVPAWSFPFATSNVAPSPAASTVIEGAFAQHVGGVGAYAFINDMLYLELSGYKTLTPKQQIALGAAPLDAPGLISGVAPYWRAAFEPHWGDHYLMVGTFGMHTEVQPFSDQIGNTFAQTDKFTDVGFDTQYQYQGSNYWLTLRGSYIHESQTLDGTNFANGGGFNPSNDLNSLKLLASLAYGGDNRIVLTGQYFDIWGSANPLLLPDNVNNSPNSNGFTAELAYIPFGLSKAPGWPWANARIGLQYTWYNKFDGTTVGASDHNTLFLHFWAAM
jgi:hypothetical protein